MNPRPWLKDEISSLYNDMMNCTKIMDVTPLVYHERVMSKGKFGDNKELAIKSS